MRKSKIEHAAEARRGVSAMVREGEMRIIWALAGWSSCARVQPAHPVPTMAMVWAGDETGESSRAVDVADEVESDGFGEVEALERVVTMLNDLLGEITSVEGEEMNEMFVRDKPLEE
jgi:hypothetical protein